MQHTCSSSKIPLQWNTWLSVLSPPQKNGLGTPACSREVLNITHHIDTAFLLSVVLPYWTRFTRGHFHNPASSACSRTDRKLDTKSLDIMTSPDFCVMTSGGTNIWEGFEEGYEKHPISLCSVFPGYPLAPIATLHELRKGTCALRPLSQHDPEIPTVTLMWMELHSMWPHMLCNTRNTSHSWPWSSLPSHLVGHPRTQTWK